MQFRRNVKRQSSSRSYGDNTSPSEANLAGGASATTRQMIHALRSRIAELEMLDKSGQHQKSALFAVCSAVSNLYSSRDMDKLFRAIHAAISTLGYKFDCFHVNLINPDGQSSLTVYHVKSGDEFAISTEHHNEYVQAPQLETWRSQKAKYFPDMGSEHPFRLFAAETVSDIRCAIDVPFDQGTLTICSKRADAFAFPSFESSLETLHILVRGLSLGLHRIADFLQVERDQGGYIIRLARSSEETILQLAMQRVRNIAMRMEHEEDWLSVVRKCHEELIKLTYFDRFSVHFFNEEDGSLFAFTVNGDQIDEGDPFTATPSVQTLLQEDQPARCDTRQQLIERGYDALHNTSAESSVDVPFAGGVLSVSVNQSHVLTDRDVAIVAHFASVINEAYRRLQDIVLLRQRQQMLLEAQKMEFVGQLATGIANNFNNMLQVIMGNISMSRLEKNFTERQLMLSHAHDAAQRAADIVRQLMVVVRPNSNRIEESVNIESCLEDIVTLAQRTFDQSISITVDIEENLPNIEIDDDQFKQIILNLLANARDAVTGLKNRSPQINIRVSEQTRKEPADSGTYIRIQVIDNGVGMDPATRARACEPFFTTKAIDEATGLGLSMVESVVGQRGGTVKLESEMGQGSTISVFLPKAPLKAPTPMRKTILVVEDEEPVRISLVDLLQHGGYYVVSANNGREGLEAFHRIVPDLVMLDLSMPEMSGRELLKEIRTVDTATRILVCTGFANAGEDFGEGTMLLEKPFIVADLFNAIEQLLQSTSSTKE